MFKNAWGYRYIILGIIWLLYVINNFDRIAVLTLLPFIQEDLKLTPIQVGQLASVFFFAYAIAQITSGILADKFGSKKIMSIAIVVFTFVTALTGMVRSFGQFIALRIGLGFGEGHHFAPAAKVINNWFPLKERGRATSFFLTSNLIAPAFAPILISFITVTYFGGEWRPVFYVFAIPGLIGVFLLWRYIYDTPKDMYEKGLLKKEEFQHITADEHEQPQKENNDSPSTKKSYRILFTDTSFYLFAILLFCQQAIYWGTTTWLTSFLVKQHGLDIKQMGFFASAPYIVAIFSILIGGWLMDKVFYRMKWVGLISYIGNIPILLLLGATDKGDSGLLLVLLLLLGFFVNLNFGSVYAYLQKRYPAQLMGSVTGISNGVGYFGSFISPLVAGYLVIVQANGSQNFSNVFIFFAGLSLVATICVLFLKEDSSKVKSTVQHRSSISEKKHVTKVT